MARDQWVLALEVLGSFEGGAAVVRDRPAPPGLGAGGHRDGPADGGARRDDRERGTAAHPAGRRPFRPGLEWVLKAYVLTFGGLLLLGGRAGDLYSIWSQACRTKASGMGFGLQVLKGSHDGSHQRARWFGTGGAALQSGRGSQVGPFRRPSPDANVGSIYAVSADPPLITAIAGSATAR